MLKGWGNLIVLNLLICMLAFFGLVAVFISLPTPQVIAQSNPHSFVTGPDSQGGNWNFSANESHTNNQDPQTAQMTFHWHQGDDHQTLDPSMWIIQIASGKVYDEQYKTAGFPAFCKAGGEIWQDIKRSGNFIGNLTDFPDINFGGEKDVNWTPSAPLRFSDALAKGMFFRLVLDTSRAPGPVRFTIGSKDLNYAKRSSPYIIGCDSHRVAAATSANPNNDTDFKVYIKAFLYESKTDSANPQEVSGAKVTLKSVAGNKILTSAELQYPESEIRTPTKIIAISNTSLGDPPKYQVIVTHPPSVGTADFNQSFDNKDDRTIIVKFYKDGTAPDADVTTGNPTGDLDSDIADRLNTDKKNCFRNYLLTTNFKKISLGRFAVCELAALVENITKFIAEIIINVPF
jgi:hypothetical protein